MKKITSFTVDTSDMPYAASFKKFVVRGEPGANFTIVALKSASDNYYNFIDGAFESGHNNINNNLNVTLVKNIYSFSINFAQGGGDFVIKLITGIDTEVSSNGNKSVISKSISKATGNATMTFSPGTLNTSNYATFPTTTSEGAVTDTNTVNIGWDVVNVSNDTHGFGLRFSSTPFTSIKVGDSYWYFSTTEAVGDNPAGDGEDSNTVTVADTSDLGVGTELFYHKGTTVPTNKAGSAVGTTLITAIDTDTKTITFSQDVAFEDGETMTFRAYGSKAIYYAINATMTFPYMTITPTKFTKTIRAGSSGTTINLNNTYGIAGGNHVTISGLGIDNSSANAVTSVTTDHDGGGADGAMVVQKSQSDLTTGAVVYFNDVHQTINLVGTLSISRYSSTNKTIYLDLDKFITVGAAS